jgi:hypothetical protein
VATDPSPDIQVTAQRPTDWVDKSMIVYTAPAEPGASAPNMVVSRDALLPGETFREYCNRQVDAFRQTLPRFAREDEGPGRVHDLDAFQILFTWTSGAGPLRQRVFFIAAGSGVVVTFAATAPADDFARHQGAFEQGLAGLRITPGRVH